MGTSYTKLEILTGNEDNTIYDSLVLSSQMTYQRIEAIGKGAMAAIFVGFTPAYVYMAADSFANGQNSKGITLTLASAAYTVLGFLLGKSAWQHKKQLEKLRQDKQNLEHKLN